MKKIIYSLGLFSLIIISLSFISKVEAQNIGSLKDVVSPGFSFTMDLYPGYTDSDVKELQKVLNADVDTTIALDGEGSRNRESKYFGNQTKQAVIKFQEKYRDTILVPNGLTSGTGIVGKSTRTKLNLLIGVMTTNNSTGSPESRGTNSAVIPVVTTPTPAAQPSMPVCSFVELLINIDVISSNLADRSRSLLGCGNTGATPSVSIEADGESGSVTVDSGDRVRISWNSRNVTSCRSSSGSRPLSGSDTVTITRSGTFVISCTGPGGTATDSVVVRLSNDDDDEDNDLVEVSCRASVSNVTASTTVTWLADASGGDGDYVFSWSGDEGLFGSSTSPIIRKIYNTPGTKTARVTVRSDGRTDVASCTVIVSPAFVQNNTPGWTNPLDVATSTNRVLSLSGGSGSMVSVKKSTSIDLKTRATFEAWVNPAEWSTKDKVSGRSDSVILSKGDFGENLDYVVSLDNGKLGFSNNTGGLYTCDSLVPLNRWTHVAVSVDEVVGQVKFYIAGQEVTNTCRGSYGKVLNKFSAITEGREVSQSSTSTAKRDNLHLGNFSSPSCEKEVDNGFVGKIDDIRIWNVVRTTEQIASSTKTAVSTTTGLVAQYLFDDLTYKDSSQSKNHGFQKGGISIVDDKDAPSYVSKPTSGFSFSFTDFSSYSDPDGYCEAEVVEEEEGTPPDRWFDFAGVVTGVGECNAKSDMKLWMVAVSACPSGGVVSTQRVTGIPTYGNGFIVIRDGYQSVPSVGDTVIGSAVNDMALKCSNGSGHYIGTVSGRLGREAGGQCSVALDGALDAAKEWVANNGGDPNDVKSMSDAMRIADILGESDSFLRLVISPALAINESLTESRLTRALVSPMLSVYETAFEPIGDAVEDLGDSIGDVFGW